MKKDRSAKKKTRGLDPAKGTFVLGKRFAKISAVEGLTLTRAMTARIKKFDREDIPAEERRRTIIGVYRKG
jgi:hypothetical protein